MYRHLLQRNVLLNVADHMSAVDAKAIYNFKKRLAHYRYAILMQLGRRLALHITPGIQGLSLGLMFSKDLKALVNVHDVP
jgi:hypothetical protein